MDNTITGRASAALASCLVFLLTLNAGSESIQMTTYMPSPSVNLKAARVTENAYLAINPANRVGIGTAGPLGPLNDKLHIVGNNDGGFFLTGTRPRIKIQDIGGIMYAMEGTGDRLDFCRFSLACDMTIRNANVGIGTNDPRQRLHVNGTIRTEGTRMDIWNKDGTGMFWFRTKGADPQAPAEGASPFLGVSINAQDQAEHVRIAPGAANALTVLRNGRVGIGTMAPHPSAVLDNTSTTQGILTPRMTTAQRNAVSSPAEGLLIYNTTTNKFNYYAAGAWREVGEGTQQATTCHVISKACSAVNCTISCDADHPTCTTGGWDGYWFQNIDVNKPIFDAGGKPTGWWVGDASWNPAQPNWTIFAVCCK